MKETDFFNFTFSTGPDNPKQKRTGNGGLAAEGNTFAFIIKIFMAKVSMIFTYSGS